MDSLGSYRIDRELSRGGMGVVYLGWDAKLGRRVAIKRALSSGTPDRGIRFQREAHLLARLDHPNIVRVHELGVEQGEPFLVMEFVEGESLQQRLDRDGPFDPQRAAELALSLAGALEHAHDRGVLHRDLKPENVLLTAAGAPILVDFGLTRGMQASSLTKSGTPLGTPGFWSPEQACGDTDAIGPRSDCFGLGATLFALLTGEAPFRGETLPAQVYGMQRGASSVEQDPALGAVCRRCMAFDPSDRYATAADLAADLERWLRGEQPLAWGPSKAPTLVAGLLTVVLGATLGVWAWASTRPPSSAGTPASDAAPVCSLAPTAARVEVAHPETPEPAGPEPLHLTRFGGSPDAAALLAAWLELARNHADKALPLLEAHVSAHPNDGHGVLWRAVAKIRLRDYEGGRADAERACELLPRDARPHVLREHAELRQVRIDVARRERATSDRKAVGAFGQRGELLQILGRSAEAVADYERALAANPNDPRLVALIASAKYLPNKSIRPQGLEAMARVDRLLAAQGQTIPDPRPPLWSKGLVGEYLSGLGSAIDALQDAGAHEQATREVERWLANRPADSRAHRRRAKLLLVAKRYAECVDANPAWAQVDPSSSQPPYFLGRALRRLGRHDEALAPLSLALERGHDEWALKERAEVYFALERYEDAYSDCEAFVPLQPSYTSARYLRALAAAKSGRLDEARAALDRFQSEPALRSAISTSQLRKLRKALQRHEK